MMPKPNRSQKTVIRSVSILPLQEKLLTGLLTYLTPSNIPHVIAGQSVLSYGMQNRHWVIYFNNTMLYFLQMGVELVFSEHIKDHQQQKTITKLAGTCQQSAEKPSINKLTQRYLRYSTTQADPYKIRIGEYDTLLHSDKTRPYFY